MILTLEQWKEILIAVSQDKGDILKAIKEKLNGKYGDTCQEREFDANHLFDVSLTMNNMQYNVKFPLLHMVAVYGHLEIIKHLIEKGANVNEKTNNRLVPSCLTVLTGHKDVVTAPLRKWANIDEEGADECTALHFAARNDHLEIVKYLIEKGANVDEKAINGFTPLHLATRHGHKDVVTTLLGKGANVNEKTADGWTPLCLAALTGHKDVVTTLLGKGANVNEKTADGWTPLCLAALTGHKDVVTTLLEKRANPLIRNKDGRTPRELAKDKNIIQFLKKSETTQITSKAIKTGSICSAIAALAVGGGCFAVGIQLPILALIGIVVAAAVLTGLVAGGITYSVSRPNDKLDKPDLEVTNQQVSEKTC